jgi:hypothetical protein
VSCELRQRVTPDVSARLCYLSSMSDSSGVAAARATSSVGWKLVLMGALLPTIVGMGGWLTGFVYSIVLAPEGNWRVLLWQYGFRFADVASASPEVAAVFRSSMQMGWANIHNAGLLMASLAFFGIRRGQSWAWMTCAYGIAWGGINDAVATVNLYRATGGGVPPLPIVALALAFSGLWLTRDCVRRERVRLAAPAFVAE